MNIAKVNREVKWGKKDKSLLLKIPFKDKILVRAVMFILRLKKYRLLLVKGNKSKITIDFEKNIMFAHYYRQTRKT
jgi:hypothetical protein